MSLCNTFRLSVVCLIIVLSSTDAPVGAFTLGRAPTGIDYITDLAQGDSILHEVKRKFNVSDNVHITEDKTTESMNNNGSFTPSNPTVKLKQDFVTEPDSKNNMNDPRTNIPNETLVPESTSAIDKVMATESAVDIINAELQSTTDSVLENITPTSIDKITDIGTTTHLIDTTTSVEINTDESATTEYVVFNISTPNITNIEESNAKIKTKEESTKLDSNVTEKTTGEIKDQKHFAPNPNKSRPIPKWKKYKTIQRKRPLYSSEEKLKESKEENNKEDIMKAETKHVRVSLQDTVTSDIPSLESLKNDLLSSGPNLQTSESKSGVISKSLVTEQTIGTPLMSSAETISAVGHESKRAGFLNFSGKTTTSEVISDMTALELTTDTMTTEVSAVKTDITTVKEPRISETESPDIDVQEDKTFQSQIVLNEDAIKEELLKEESIQDNQENVKRQREDLVNSNADLTGISYANPEKSDETNLSSELSVRPINGERSKNSTLYTVNPNYKPMKKIEVVPPKQFVRDPDDNSWRNESLSSLGIVFKPKNSSKPFTQVLKNKTETEWNNLSEKDIKNDLPDLRERLQKMAEKRKSKRKKIDSFGNIVYFDYDENSNSAEHSGVTMGELTSTVTTYSPASQISSQGIDSTTEGPNNSTKAPTTLTTGVNKIYYSTKTPKELLHEYYDSTDEDDSDYLNMAQIDLKKFTTSLRSSTPFHPSTIVAKQPDWLRSSDKLSYNAFPERKATVQYFPPLTTQRVNINDYDNDFKFKMESFTTESDLPKPVSIERPTTPVSVGTGAAEPDYTKALMFSQPQLPPAPGVARDDGSFDSGTFAVKHYKDFVNEAARVSEYDKDLGYVPYTEAPAEGVTKADLIRYEKEKPRTIDRGYDYEAQFRKDLLQKFVDNFNQNNERYRPDFPILFNSSIIHRGAPHGRESASSRAFMRGSYANDLFKPKFGSAKKACDPNCEKITVELSPAYELHYYVPDQEEKEEVVSQPVTLPYQYRL